MFNLIIKHGFDLHVIVINECESSYILPGIKTSTQLS